MKEGTMNGYKDEVTVEVKINGNKVASVNYGGIQMNTNWNVCPRLYKAIYRIWRATFSGAGEVE